MTFLLIPYLDLFNRNYLMSTFQRKYNKHYFSTSQVLLYPKGGANSNNVIRKAVSETATQSTKPPLVKTHSPNINEANISTKFPTNHAMNDIVESSNIPTTAFSKSPSRFDSTQEKLLKNNPNRSNLSNTSSETSLCKDPNKLGVNIPARAYAVRSLNVPDQFTKDPQALKNNPPIGKSGMRHYEIQRQECIIPGCIDKQCIGLCGLPGRRSAVGHGSHGKSPAHEMDKKTIFKVANPDFSGKPKDQNIIVYSKAHNTPVTAVHSQGTQEVQNNQTIQQVLDTYEDKN
jgi:hypothetical protein